MSRAVDPVVVRFSLATSAPLNSHWDGRPEEYDQLRQCWLNAVLVRHVAAERRDR
jgi:hypothetical protein